jgi:hypothetical protein
VIQRRVGGTAMWTKPENEQYGDELYLAGERVKPGVYQQVGTKRTVILECEDLLPASLDGRIACYACVRNTWGYNQNAGESRITTPTRQQVKNGV